MNFSSTLFTLLLAVSCLLTTNETRALTNTQCALLGGLIGSTYLLLMREPVKEFKPRYSLKKVGAIKCICSKEYFYNFWYFFYDGFIGQQGKTRKDAHGILGTTAYYLMPIKKAGSTVAFGYTLYRIGLNHDKHIANLAKHKEEKSVP